MSNWRHSVSNRSYSIEQKWMVSTSRVTRTISLITDTSFFPDFRGYYRGKILVIHGVRPRLIGEEPIEN
jgi:hypothetical protein